MIIDLKSLYTGNKEVDYKIDRIIKFHKNISTYKEHEALQLIENLKRKYKVLIEADRVKRKAIYGWNKKDLTLEIEKLSKKFGPIYKDINNSILNDFDQEFDYDESTSQRQLENLMNKHINTDKLIVMTTILATVAYGIYNDVSENMRQALDKWAQTNEVTLNPPGDFVSRATQYIQVNFYSKGKMVEIMNNYRNTLSSKLIGAWEDREGRNWKDIFYDFKDALKDEAFQDYQIERIVRTELSDVANQSAWDAAKESGLDMKAYFAPDPEGCEDCQQLAQDTLDAGGYDMDDEEVGDLPHPNCVHAWYYEPVEPEDNVEEE